MNKKKWFCNMLLGVSMLAVLLVLCGFNGGGVSCSQDDECLTYTYGVDQNYTYPAYESVEGDDQILTLYVPLGQETTIPLKAVLTPTEGHDMTEFFDEDTVWKFSADAMPDGLILGESTAEVIDSNLVVAATVTVPAQTSKKEFGLTSITLTNSKQITLSAASMQLKVTATDLNCSLCGGNIQQDGTYAHKICEICGGECDGTTYEHKSCEVCGGVCDGTAYDHKSCEVCGGVCDGTAYAHKTCEICGATCDGTTYEHKACEVCGGKCDGTAYEHKACEICGGKCDGTAYAHMSCEVCAGKCDGTAYEHMSCKVCGGKCDGTSYVHKKGSACINGDNGNASNKNDGNTSSKTGEKKGTAKVVATGDYANIALYAGLAMAALLVLIVLVVYKKKYTK